MKIDIRQALSTDAEMIAELSRKTFYDTFASYNTKEDMDKFMSEQFAKEALMKEVGAKGNIFLLAYDNNEVVGYARIRENNSPKALKEWRTLEIARIYATTQSIGKGVGSALMKECIAIAKEKEKQIIWLGVWEKNQTAIDFYKRWGFEKFDEHDFILGNDVQRDWLMKKDIV